MSFHPQSGADFNIDVRTLERMREGTNDFCILDIREPWELGVCRFEESLDVPMRFLPTRMGELPRDKPMVVVCHHGVRSFHATQWLRQAGFANALNLVGGIDAWARQVDPAFATY